MDRARRADARSLAGRYPPLRRFHDNDTLLHDRVSEVLGLHYKMPWPNRELAVGAAVPPLAAV